MQKQYLIYLICVFIFLSCGPIRNCVIRYVPIEKTTYIHDTTTITKTYRDTTIVLKPDSLQNNIDLSPEGSAMRYKDGLVAPDTPKDTTSFLKNDFAESTAQISGGHLYHTLYTYPRPIDVKIPEVKITSKHFKTEAKEVLVAPAVPVEKVKYRVPQWCWGLLGVNLLAIALFLLKRRFFR